MRGLRCFNRGRRPRTPRRHSRGPRHPTPCPRGHARAWPSLLQPGPAAPNPPPSLAGAPAPHSVPARPRTCVAFAASTGAGGPEPPAVTRGGPGAPLRAREATHVRGLRCFNRGRRPRTPRRHSRGPRRPTPCPRGHARAWPSLLQPGPAAPNPPPSLAGAPAPHSVPARPRTCVAFAASTGAGGPEPPAVTRGGPGAPLRAREATHVRGLRCFNRGRQLSLVFVSGHALRRRGAIGSVVYPCHRQTVR